MKYELWRENVLGERLIEVAHVFRFLPKDKLGGNAWPKVIHDWGDKVGQASQAANDDTALTDAERLEAIVRSQRPDAA
jgi:hypothetical protein